jgi:plastocyanin
MKKVTSTGFSLLFSSMLLVNVAVADSAVTVVEIESGTNRFAPEIVTIPKGGVIRWENNDSEQPSHDFASIPGPKPENRELKVIELRAGEVAEHTFNIPGVYDYFCYIHKGMVGRVIVE